MQYFCLSTGKINPMSPGKNCRDFGDNVVNVSRNLYIGPYSKEHDTLEHNIHQHIVA